MSKFRKISYLILAALLVIAIFSRSQIEDFFLKSKQKIQNFTATAENLMLERVDRRVSEPPPLRAEKESENARLTVSGTIEWTNIQRGDNNLTQLKQNPKLDAAALKKAQDMFEKQYFEHVSPTGKDAEDLANSVNYEYLSIGENLALGNFLDDRELVDAWMASPGHRENILNAGFTEIGVAVIPGRYEGKDTWIAVQEFGTPLSICPAVDSSLKTTIEQNSKKIDQLSEQISKLRNGIENAEGSDREISRKIKDYNALVKDYNSLVARTKDLVSTYNSQVKQFNSCIKDESH